MRSKLLILLHFWLFWTWAELVRRSPGNCLLLCCLTVLTPWAPVGDATLPSATAFGSLISFVINHSFGEHVEQDAGVGPVTSCLQAGCACPTHFIHLVPPHSALLWLQPARSKATPVLLCSFGLSKQNGGSMYGETEHFEKKIWTAHGNVRGQGVALKTPFWFCTRSYSKNADGRHSQDSVQKDHCAADPAPDPAAEAHSSVCSGVAPLCRESQEEKVSASNSFQVWSLLQWQQRNLKIFSCLTDQNLDPS